MRCWGGTAGCAGVELGYACRHFEVRIRKIAQWKRAAPDCVRGGPSNFSTVSIIAGGKNSDAFLRCWKQDGCAIMLLTRGSPVRRGGGASGFLACGQGAALTSRSTFVYLGSLRLAAPLLVPHTSQKKACMGHPGKQCVGLTERAYPRLKSRGFCRASLARGGWWVRRDLISPRSQKRDLGHPK